MIFSNINIYLHCPFHDVEICARNILNLILFKWNLHHELCLASSFSWLFFEYQLFLTLDCDPQTKEELKVVSFILESLLHNLEWSLYSQLLKFLFKNYSDSMLSILHIQTTREPFLQRSIFLMLKVLHWLQVSFQAQVMVWVRPLKFLRVWDQKNFFVHVNLLESLDHKFLNWKETWDKLV